MKRYEATVEVTHEEWEAIQASFSVDLREGEERYNEEVINKYDLRAGTNPLGLMFEFENGTKMLPLSFSGTKGLCLSTNYSKFIKVDM